MINNTVIINHIGVFTGYPPGVTTGDRKGKDTTMKSNLGFQLVYDDTPEEIAAKAAKTEADRKIAEDAAKKAAASGGTGDDDNFKKFNFTTEQQDFFNRKLAEERRTFAAQNQKTIDELKKVQAATTTSAKEKTDLQARIEELQRQHMSKEEIAKQDQERKEQEWRTQVAQKDSDAKKWEKLYHESTITRALQDGAVDAGAFSAGQIIDMLETKTKLVQELDSNNNPTGNFIPRVHLTDVDKDGKTVILDLTVKEALTKMKNTPEKYGNLFTSTINGGLGQNGNVSGGRRGGKNPKDMTAAEWAEARKKDPTLAFANN